MTLIYTLIAWAVACAIIGGSIARKRERSPGVVEAYIVDKVLLVAAALLFTYIVWNIMVIGAQA